jgi:hypothetical protein
MENRRWYGGRIEMKKTLPILAAEWSRAWKGPFDGRDPRSLALPGRCDPSKILPGTTLAERLLFASHFMMALREDKALLDNHHETIAGRVLASMQYAGCRIGKQPLDLKAFVEVFKRCVAASRRAEHFHQTVLEPKETQMRNARAVQPAETAIEDFEIRTFADLIGQGPTDILHGSMPADRSAFVRHIFAVMKRQPQLFALPVRTLVHRLREQTRDLEIRPDVSVGQWLQKLDLSENAYETVMKILFAIRQRHVQERVALRVFGEKA